MSTVYIGADPGCSGAIAFLSPDGSLEHVDDWPVITDRTLKWVDGAALQSLLLDRVGGRRAFACVERVGSMPKQGVASTFAFGVAYGSILGVLQAAHVAIGLVTPRTWKAAAGLGDDKHASLHRARMLYPDADIPLVKHHNKAEAILIARYGLSRRPT